MRRLHLRKLVRRPKNEKCPESSECRFHDGRCETCGFRLVDSARDEMRREDPRY